ncbi:MAG: substrate-binding domain-containing protein [Armatimonadota bacterium]|nr:substrate-binding domain-containing protein [bacterium]MCS7309405.1 substrate-binding domain-containing protein [Armatimonadota bacterium]MDW8105236.1 substrate-binding domain-containing protein [Armatimonadota bacterium]MDW8289151.1 substrate-binding domain-containing protein [Armatimonadota bacterium]
MRTGTWLMLLSAGVALVLFGCARRQPATGEADTAGAGKKLVVAVMPKLKGIDYFNAVERGAREAAQELGNIDLTYDGPTEGKVDLQIPFIESWTLQKVDVIAVACNDPDAISPALKRARDRGVHVITYDADANAEKSGRQFFVNQATFEDIGRALVDEMAAQVGEEAKVAIVSSSPTAPNQNAWIAVMKRYMAERYPKMQIVTIQYPEEDQGRAFSMTQDILKTYPDVKGIFGISSVAFPGAADAVRQAGKKGQVAVVGLSTPKSMREFVKDGTVKTVILWNPVDLGYLTVYVAKAVAEGTLKPGATEFEAGRLGKVKVQGDQILLGPPMKFTAENIDQYDF